VHQVLCRHLFGFLPVEAIEHLPDGVEIDLHPLAPQVHEGRLHVGERLQLLARELVLAEGHLPVELDDGVEGEPGLGLHVRRLGVGLRGEALLRPPPGPPRGQLHPEARLPQQRGVLAEEGVRLLGIELQASGIRLLEALLDGGPHAHCLTEGREQVGPRPEVGALEDAGSGGLGVPRLGHVDLEAGVVGGLEAVAERPGTGIGLDLLALVWDLRLFEAEDEPERRLGGHRDAAAPRLQLPGQMRELVRVLLHPPVGGAEGVEPLIVQAVERGGRAVGRASVLPRPHDEIDEIAKDLPQNRARRGLRRTLVGPRERTAGGGHGLNEGSQPIGLLAPKHRLPAGAVGTVPFLQAGQKLLAGHQRPRVPDDLCPVAHVAPDQPPRRPHPTIVDAPEQVGDRHRGKRNDRHAPRREGGICVVGRRVAHHGRRRHRRPVRRGQPRHEGLRLGPKINAAFIEHVGQRTGPTGPRQHRRVGRVHLRLVVGRLPPEIQLTILPAEMKQTHKSTFRAAEP